MKEEWKSKLNKDPTDWLMQSNPWTKYNTFTRLLGKSEKSEEAVSIRKQLTENDQMQQIIQEAADWFPKSCTRHNDPKMSHYKLRMLADFGFRKGDPDIDALIPNVTRHTEGGLYAVRQELPQKGKGFTKPDPANNEWHALPCDSPLITATLLQLGYKDAKVEKAADLIKEKWSTPEGWFCDFFFVRGIRKKLKVGCPMAGLQALEVFSYFPAYKETEYAKNAFAPIKYHKEYGKSIYYFGRSKKFWTMKYPFVWYNALYLAMVLSQFHFATHQAVMKELIEWIESSQDETGRFTPTSMFMLYKGWEFANKKEPSPWITFLCCNILKNYYGNLKQAD